MTTNASVWYALYTKPHAERQVTQLLAARGIETYLPMLTVWRARRRQIETEPLFPCYGFACFDLSTRQLSEARWTPGLKSIVSSEGHPIPVPATVLAYMRRREVELNTEMGQQLRPGERVRMIEGPLKDLEVVFEGQRSGGERARVLVAMLGRLTHCNVSEAWLGAA